jgi:hypothetical protein
MNPTHPEPLAADLEGELTTRRPVTINEHALFLDSLLTQADLDEIDELMQLDPYAGDPPSKRSDKETDRLLSILDALDERGNG